ncbi:16S rRNA (guanine(966)-N(2))-methyltransferase RsmD [Halobacillus locisalis]|uniref:16S rRNA (Guanine(966)-N(2))-methyltransferase RsmD n=1 Tax=Halobacillus locisalis TaxID=220753 RepID=A0A838CQF1_9BACI|nr:16S rRNA (guanine(966)-N(2))-methyltransferase RsmD [Halobacillus locisalis]MBA2174287.1 16S rRNA (guanine(966)-N(2))-methyltransferase RsmD [Halobacillus locisalis]
MLLERGVKRMRVIAGDFKGRQLKSVPTHQTRPTTDKVKEAVFHVIGPFFEGGRALDLFAGSGGLGLEALSRGVESCVFVDQQHKAIQTIYENIKILGVEDRTEVFRTDAKRALKAAGKRGLTFDYIFLDPPYKKFSYEDLMEALLEHQLISDHGIVICEHDASEKIPEDVGRLQLQKTDIYGSNIGVSIFK